MRTKCHVMVAVLVVSLAGLTTGCKKKAAVAPPAPPPPHQLAPPAPKAPAASITAEPATITPGQAVTLAWSSTGATEVTISGLGSVAVEGRQEVRPVTSATYHLVAKGPGGSASASATVNVVAPPPPPTPPRAESKSLLERVETELSDAYFDYDKSGIRDDARSTLAKDAEALRSILADFPVGVIVLEGHCDERGSAQYNLGLGDNRATSARSYLETLGVKTDRLKTLTYGKERPQCTESTESCWQRNRRVHFSAEGPSSATN